MSNQSIIFQKPNKLRVDFWLNVRIILWQDLFHMCLVFCFSLVFWFSFFVPLWKVCWNNSTLAFCPWNKASPQYRDSVCQLTCHMRVLLFCSVVVVVISPVFSSALNSLFCKWDLPVFTLPFNMALSMYLSATGHYNPFFPSKLFRPITAVPNVTWPDLSALQVRYTVFSHSFLTLEDTQCPLA